MLDVLYVICTRLRPSHLSVRVGDGSQHSEEIVKKSWIAPLNAIIIIIIIIIISLCVCMCIFACLHTFLTLCMCGNHTMFFLVVFFLQRTFVGEYKQRVAGLRWYASGKELFKLIYNIMLLTRQLYLYWFLSHLIASFWRSLAAAFKLFAPLYTTFCSQGINISFELTASWKAWKTEAWFMNLCICTSTEF